MSPPSASPAPDEPAIRAQLARLLDSPQFRGSRNLTGFLTFVVERTLEGRADEIKEYTVGVEVLGRGPDFDPRADGVVRVQAGQMRKKLAAYYD